MVTPSDKPLVLAIETSCDDTACSLLDGEGRVLASVVASQLEPHRPYGGVVPEIASREHLSNWPTVWAETLERAAVSPSDIGLVAATRGPGLVGSLLVGLSTGKAIAWGLGRPFYAVHHIAGHIFSPFLDPDGGPARAVPERFVALVVSGGHTSLFEVEDQAPRVVAETRDDAIGEVFDKVGKRLGLPYPQGPVVDRLAESEGLEGQRNVEALPIPRATEDLFFSYSGLKSAAIRQLEKLERQGGGDESLPIGPDGPTSAQVSLLVEFRRAAVGQVIDRLTHYHRRHPFSSLAVSGGVAANRLLRRELLTWSAHHGVELFLVPLAFCGDNAAMIAHVALLRYRSEGESSPHGDPWSVEAASRLPIDSWN